MRPLRFLLPLSAGMILAACRPEVPDYGNTLACSHPAVVENIKNGLLLHLAEETQRFVRQDSKDLIDAGKIMKAAEQLVLTLNGSGQQEQGGEAVCEGNISISIPENILHTASLNARLLYGEQTLNQAVRQNIDGSSPSYNDNGVFSQTFRYLPQNSDGNFQMTYTENGLKPTYRAVLTALLPYGIKDTLMIDGQAVSLEQILRADLEKAVETAEKYEEPASAELPPLSEPEILTPSENKNTEIPFAADDVEYARANYQDAVKEMNAQWNKIDPAIQEELAYDERNWFAKKTADCQQASAHAENPLQAEYRRLQCDARMTRERIQYLKGYSAP